MINKQQPLPIYQIDYICYYYVRGNKGDLRQCIVINIQRISQCQSKTLRLNFGPLHLLDGYIDDPNKSYMRKGSRVSQIAGKDFNISLAMATFQKNNEKKLAIPASF